MRPFILIFLGGGLGSVLRYTTGVWIHRLHPSAFPLGTLAVNVLGCLLIGFLASLMTDQASVRYEYRLAILVGVLGGFTTFSSFSWETVRLLHDGRLLTAFLNVATSVVLGLSATGLGVWCAYLIQRPSVQP